MDYTDDIDGDFGSSYRVVVNHEEQYSIWPSDRDIPPGWKDVGVSDTKEKCLAYIDEVWTDITPLSVRYSLGETKAT
ncbi:MAG: MbtH family protein [Pseudonocardiaceae bacterium]